LVLSPGFKGNHVLIANHHNFVVGKNIGQAFFLLYLEIFVGKAEKSRGDSSIPGKIS